MEVRYYLCQKGKQVQKGFVRHFVIKSKYSWNEFKLTSWRKNQYAKHLIKLIAKCITIEYTLDNQNKLSKEENYLYKHIIEANEI